MADPFPKIPMGQTPDGTETVIARQGGMLRRFALSALLPFFKGATGAAGAAGAKGDTGPNPWTDLGIVTVSERMTLTIAAGARSVVVQNVTGLKKGDKVVLVPVAALPTGYLLGGAAAVADGTLSVQVFCPALSIGASYTFDARVLVARA